jgi:holo-[acyl-carrier protein] synthase
MHTVALLTNPFLSFVGASFAAKEAAIKAHHHRRLTFHEIVVRRATTTGAFQQQLQQQHDDEDGEDRPTRLGSGPPVAIIKAEDGVGSDREAALSISHDGDYATAVCMAFDPTGTTA